MCPSETLPTTRPSESPPRRLPRRAARAVLVPLLAAAFAAAACRTAPPPPRAGAVHGTVYVAAESSPLQVFLPDFELSLRELSSGRTTATARTDVFGRYYFERQPPGTYALQWAAQRGWAAGRYPQDLVIHRGLEHPQQIRLTPEAKHVALVGTVRLQDGSTPGIVDEYFDLVKTPRVSLHDGRAVIHPPVRSDHNAAFALAVPEVSLAPGARLHAAIDGAGATASPGAAPSAGYVRADVVLPNHRPRILAVQAIAQSGRVVRDAAAGEVVTGEVVVSDRDGDPVSVSWKGQVPAGSVAPANHQAVWTLARSPGTYTLYALVTDDRGGYSSGRLDVAVDRTSEVFSGVVLDKRTRAAIDRADVTVNGRRTATDGNGHFMLEVPLAERYLIDVRRHGYAFASKTLDHGDRGTTWYLVPAQTEKVDPSRPIELLDRRPGVAPGRGARLVIEPGSLVDGDGQEPVGNIFADFATIDIGDDEAPGDWAARRGETETGLISYGIAYVELYDARGQTYQLRKDHPARIEIPINGARPGEVPRGAPQEIDVWSYDDGDGFWKPSGRAKLDPAQAVYAGSVDHFSYVNLDRPGPVSCVRVVIDPFFRNKHLKVSDVQGDGIDYPTAKTAKMDQVLNAIYRIPPNQEIAVDVLEKPGGSKIAATIEAFDQKQPGNGWQLLAGNRVKAGPAVATLSPPYPYAQCPIAITLKRPGAAHRKSSFLSYKGVIQEAEAKAYYALVDRSGKRGTLEKWWGHNGFDKNGKVARPGTGESYVQTTYLNDNDLGSGRDMHFYRRADGTVASWVANYGKFDQSHGNADLALKLDRNAATVCMEYSPLEDSAGNRIDLQGNKLDPRAADYPTKVLAASVVKFFVYQNNQRQTAADLDGYGPKRIPNLCMNCHGGTVRNGRYAKPEHADLGAFFRELDYNTYKFPRGASAPDPQQKRAFKEQNRIVRGTATGPGSKISTAAIKELVDVWYRDGAGDVDQDDCQVRQGSIVADSIPAGWRRPGGVDQHYCQVIGRSCRTCHLAHENYPFDTYAGVKASQGSILGYVTSPGSTAMPHSIVTYRNFWLSDPHRPSLVKTFAFPQPAP